MTEEELREIGERWPNRISARDPLDSQDVRALLAEVRRLRRLVEEVAYGMRQGRRISALLSNHKCGSPFAELIRPAGWCSICCGCGERFEVI